MAALRFASPQEENANRFVDANLVKLQVESGQDNLQLSGTVRDAGQQYQPKLVTDSDERLIRGECNCSFYIRNKLHRGPCEHMLALRALHSRHSRRQKSH